MYFDDDELTLYYALLNEESSNFDEKKSSCENFDVLGKLAHDGEGLVLYGAGAMCNYFLDVYEHIPIKYIVDQKVVHGHTERRGLHWVFPIEKLKEENSNIPILVTPVNAAKSIFDILHSEGFENISILSELEWKRECVKNGVDYLKNHPELQECYLRLWRRNRRRETEKQIMNLQIESMQTLLAKQVVTCNRLNKLFFHSNHLLNIVIDHLDDEALRAELIEDQMKYRFSEVFGNGYIPDLRNPKSFNEKCLTMQIREADNILFATVTDKFDMKQWVAQRVGGQYVVPALGVWDDPDKIQWEDLPDNFLLKATNGGESENIFLVKKNDEITRTKAVKIVRQWMMRSANVYCAGFNGTFKHVRQRILAEKNIEKRPGDLYNYKFWFFHGQPRLYNISYTDIERESHRILNVSFFYMDGTPVNVRSSIYKPLVNWRKTSQFQEMVEVATVLAEPFEFVRVDIMETLDRFYVGELTLAPDGGLRPFDDDLDQELGRFW